jgi:hypothetical protein
MNMADDSELTALSGFRIGLFCAYANVLAPRFYAFHSRSIVALGFLAYSTLIGGAYLWEFGDAFPWGKFVGLSIFGQIMAYVMFRVYRHYYPENWDRSDSRSHKS